MLNVDTRLTLDDDTLASPNLCDRFSVEDLKRIGIYCAEGFQRDKQSRTAWERRTASAMDLAMQTSQEKTFPWPGCANVKFPLITIATMQFHSRAYPQLIQGTEVVKCRTLGDDPQGAKRERADRIATHMSYQVLEEDQSWEEQHDRLLINYCIVGTAFIKTYFSSTKGHNVSELVLANDLVLNYWAKSVDDCSRKTHVFPLTRNDVHEKIMRGAYRDISEEAWFQGRPTVIAVAQVDQARNDRQGTAPPQPDETTPFTGLEQHCWLDLDGDGYEEPYVVTLEKENKCVLRIVARFDNADIERNDNNAIIKIRANEYFTKFGFIAAPDGGIYDVGFGTLLGPLNESVDTAINQLFDAGTMATTAGGFLGRGVKIRSGNYTFGPLEWKRVDSTGDDLTKNIFPLPVREPSSVLYELLVLLINYTNRISGSTDIMVGENPGQNTPAETSRNMIEQGSKIYNALFKRFWRSLREEFKKLYLLNALYLPVKSAYSANAFALREDYLGDPRDVVPVADPNLTSDSQRLQQAMAMKQFAAQTPGYDPVAVERHVLKTMRIDGIDIFFPGPKKIPPPPNPTIMVEQLKAQTKQMQMKQKMDEVAMKLAAEQKLVQAQIVKLEADAALAIAQAHGVKSGHEIAAFEAAIGAKKAHMDSLRQNFEAIMNVFQTQQELQLDGNHDTGGVPGVASPSGNGAVQSVDSPAGGSA